MSNNQKRAKSGTSKTLLVLLTVAIFITVAVATLVVLALVGTGENKPVESGTQSNEQTEKPKPAKDPEIVVNNSTAIGNNELRALIDEGETGFLYIGRPTCPHCKIFVPLLNNVTAQFSDEVYYFNTDAARSEDSAAMSELLGVLNISSVPTFMWLENGVEVSRLDDTENEQAIADFMAQFRLAL